MPITYIRSTGALSFDPVTPRDQAVGPIGVIVSPSNPDEVVQPQRHGRTGTGRRLQTGLAVAALTAIAALAIAATVS